MDIDTFCDDTPRLFQIRLEAKRKYDEIKERQEWERMRFQTVILVNKDRKKQNQVKPKDLIEFPWEKGSKIKDIKKEREKIDYIVAKERRRRKKYGKQF